MSDPALNLPIRSTFDPKGTDAAERALTRLQQAQAKAAPRAQGGDAAFKATGQAAQQAERDVLRYASAMASAQRATGDAAGSVQTWRAALGQMTPGTIEAHQAVTRLAQAEKQLAGGAGAQFAKSFKDGLLGVVGPAAAATAALGAATATVSSFVDAFKFKAELDATRASINAQLTGVRDLNQVYSEAAEFAGRFKLTQQETAQAISASIGVMRASKAPIEDILSVLARMQILSPEQSLQEAAIALKALASGDTTSLVTRFEVGRDVANQMKAEIRGGADAVQVMSQFLGDVGIGMDALAAKASGAQGAIKDLAIAQEDLALAQAKFAEGPGLAILEHWTKVVSGTTRILTGDFEAMGASLAAAAQPQGLLGIAEASAAASAAAAQLAQTTAVAASAADMHGGAIGMEIDAAIRAEAAIQAETQAQTESTFASLTDAAAKDEQAAKTDLLRAQTEAAVTAFMDLHPNIDASGVAALVTAGKIDPLLGQLIMARIRADEARDALARFNSLAGISAAQAQSDFRAGERSGGRVRTLAEERAAADRLAEIQRNQARTAKEQLQADLAIARAKGDQKTQVDLLRQSQKGLIEGSAEWKNVEAQILSLQKQGGRAGGGGGGRAGGGSARVSQAEQTATRLQDIERQGGEKIAAINEQTQEKIAAIEAKYAEQRARAQRALMDDIARANASTAFEQQINDFDQFQKDLSDEQRAALADREAAEAEYNAKVAQYQEEARQAAASGDAELAADILDARTKQAEAEKEIAEKAAAARRAGGDAAAVAREAQEATDAARRQADTEIAIAQAKAAERAGAEQAEKDAVVAQAEEQKAKVVSAAEEQAARVKGASDAQRATVVNNLRDQASAADAWADAIAAAAGRAQGAMDGVTGPPATTPGEGGEPTGEGVAGGGGAGPGVRGFGGGRSAGAGGGGSVADAIQTLQDASEIIKVIKPFVAGNKGAVKLLNEYQLTVRSAVGSLLAIQDLRARLVQPQPVLDPAKVEQLKADVEYVLRLMMTIDASATSKVRVLARYLETEKSAVDILNTVIELRKNLSAPTPPIDANYVLALIATANAVLALLFSQLIPLKQREVDSLKSYADAAQSSVGVLSGVANLRKELADQKDVSPFDMGLIMGLVKRIAEITRMVEGQIVPLTEQQAAGLETYATAAGAAVELLSGTAALRKELSDQADVSPFDMGLIRGLAMRARQITQIVLAELLPQTEEQAAAMDRYASAQSAAVAIVKDTAGLRKELAEGLAGGALPVAAIRALAADARRITETVVHDMAPMSEETAAAAQRWADTTGAAVSTISDVLGLPGKMFADYQSPTDAQINMAVNDAKRLVDGIARAAAVYDTEGLEAAKAFGEANSAILGSFKDQLLFAQALGSGDFRVNPNDLKLFEQGMAMTIATAGRLGAQAVAIPAGNIAALQAVTAANTAAYESLIRLAAVPIGNLGALAGGYGGRQGGRQGGGAGVTNTFHNTFVLPNGTTQQMAREIMQFIQRQIGARR